MFKKVAFGICAVAGVLTINPALGYVAASAATYALGGGSMIWYNTFGMAYGAALLPVASFAGSAGLAGSEMLVNYTSSFFDASNPDQSITPLLID